MTRRYAVYFAPPAGSALEAFGRRWLGRDHVTGGDVAPLRIEGIDPDAHRRLTRSARHYGFHATLKAPFALADGRTADDLHQAAETFAGKRTAFEAPGLDLSKISRWIAFILSRPSPDMDRLAADCVRDFEPFRAPLSEADIARRRQSALTARQDAQLLAYGYPHIFEDFQFHMTLAGPLDHEDQDAILDRLRSHAADIEGMPLRVDAIALYEQQDREKPFIQTGRFPFRASSSS